MAASIEESYTFRSISTNKAHPSGEWVGYYTYPKAAAKCPMHLTLNFDQNTIEGSGIDNNGQFLIHGTSDELNSRLQFTKQYIGKSAVEYDARFQGEEIVGVW
ncbi:MAG TPA: hypothetical protein VFU86_23625 [Terriglobales bacterium]|nr:hypothetical protein [Terriglobales bacterium]